MVDSFRDVLNSVYSESTRSTYQTGVRSYRNWATKFNIENYWPPQERHICLWITHLACYNQPTTSKPLSYSTIHTYLTALNSMMIQEGRQGIENMIILERFMKGLKRKIGTRKNKKKPLTLGDINSMRITTYLDWVMQGICLVGFFGLMRVGELLSSNMVVQNVTVIDDDHAEIFLPTSKTDSFKRGVTIYIPSHSEGACPVRFLKQYVGSREGGRLFTDHHDRAISRARFVAWLKKTLNHGDEYSGHSLRRGGDMALSAAGCPLHIIKQWGRWRSDAVQEYLQVSSSTMKLYSRRINSLQQESDRSLWSSGNLWNERVNEFGRKISRS